MEESKMKVDKEYAIRSYIRSDHNFLKAQENKTGYKYETFGAWRRANPDKPAASKNYPDDEYLLVIRAYRDYFDKKYASTGLDI